MRKPDYISTEQTRYQPTTIEKIESDIGFHVKKKMNVDDMYMDKDSQIRAIEKTFDDAREPIEKHHSKANVFAVEEYRILPDSDMWKYPCAQVIITIQLNKEHFTSTIFFNIQYLLLLKKSEKQRWGLWVNDFSSENIALFVRKPLIFPEIKNKPYILFKLIILYIFCHSFIFLML